MSSLSATQGSASSQKVCRTGITPAGSSNVPTLRMSHPGRRDGDSSASEEPHSGQKCRRSGWPLPPGLLNVFIAPSIVTASFGTATSVAKAVPVKR
jgi:hypothetical protein